MSALERLRQELPDLAKDVRLNLQSVMTTTSSLQRDQLYGVAVAAAAASRNPRLLEATVADAREATSPGVVEDALAAAALMAMNNVYYRFRHGQGEGYATMPARLRMNRMVNPATSKRDFELFSLAVSTIFGCQYCTAAHERVVVEAGVTTEAVHDAVRVAATFHAAAVALDVAHALASAPAASAPAA